jgi:ribonuclease HI
MMVQFFTDGACRGNPGPGGWGVVMYYGEHRKSLYGAQAHTTNNRMELTAALEALLALKCPSQVAITTDSQYLRKGMLEWLANWKRRGWRTASNKPVKNKDLWEKLDQQIAIHDVSWHWVKGHSGHPENTLADELANQAIDEWLDQQRAG